MIEWLRLGFEGVELCRFYLKYVYFYFVDDVSEYE